MIKGNYKTSQKVFCIICGKEIKNAGNKMKKFCSEKCRYEHIKNTRIKYRNCRACGQEFKVTTHYRFFCSDECRKLVNEINVKNHTQRQDIKEKRRNHARKIRETEEGYLKALYERMMFRLKGGVTYEEIKTLYYSTNSCFYCGKEITPFTVDKQIDHKIPISRGGTNNINNLVICCKSCNSGKRELTDLEYFEHRKGKKYARNKINND